MNVDILNLLNAAADRYGLPRSLVVAVAQQESGGDPNAVSSAGAEGVMQLMPATAVSLGVSNPFDPAENIDGGVRYLSQLMAEFGGDPHLALAAYNWGPGNVAKNGANNWPAETVNYVSSILSKVGDAASSVEVAVTGEILPPSSANGTSNLVMIAIAAGLALWAWSEVFG